MKLIPFTVDSALLRELGERLVGKPHVALAELIKNSYDADATEVKIQFASDSIEVVDNGHGMTFEEFKSYWMRIGSPHKERQEKSRALHRPLTGKKGVGRLAVQFLAERLQINTAAAQSQHEILASVDWTKAVVAGSLTEATAEYELTPRGVLYPGGAQHGTLLRLSGLKQDWTAEQIGRLSQEVWALQPPFGVGALRARDDFKIDLVDENGEPVEAFEDKLQPYLKLWHAKIHGRYDRGKSESTTITVEFSDGQTHQYRHEVTSDSLAQVDFEIRVFNTAGRQAHGVRVDELRRYLATFGGVHIYDSGFHLPYYGPESDWLHVQLDHSRRLSASELLPRDLQVERGLNFLPTNLRLLGVVRIDTARERRVAARSDSRDILDISVTRDRLTDNGAYEELVGIVRTGLDFYATREALREFKSAEAVRPVEVSQDRLHRVESVVEAHSDEIPRSVVRRLKADLRQAVEAADAESRYRSEQANLLGTLASVGISSLAYEHEFSRQFNVLETIAARLSRQASGRPSKRQLEELAKELGAWVEEARSTRSLFVGMTSEENRTTRARLKARPFLEQLKRDLRLLTRGVTIDLEPVSEDVRLPLGTQAEWSAVFQNLFLNAANATLDCDDRRVVVSAGVVGRAHTVTVSDSGVGVDLRRSEELFEPFVRRAKISRERRRLGLGGTGLGLTIVRMITQTLGCRVKFVSPSSGLSTALRISWSEQK